MIQLIISRRNIFNWNYLLSRSFHKLLSQPSRNRHFYKSFSSTWSIYISPSVRIYSESCFPTNFATSKKPVIVMSIRIGSYTNRTDIFCFTKSKSSSWVLKTLYSSHASSLFSFLCFVCCNSAFVCSSHRKICTVSN